MTERNSWLPPLVLLEDFGGEWNRYVEKVYAYFKQDFVDHKPVFRGRRLGLKRHPLSQGKEATFWHMISEGNDEANRTPDLRRCERIRWPRPIIELADVKGLKVWASIRNNEHRGGSGNSDSVVSGSLASPTPPRGGEPKERGDEENETESRSDL